MNQKGGDVYTMGFNYGPQMQPYGDGWLTRTPKADYRKLDTLDDFVHVDLTPDGQCPEHLTSRKTDFRMNDLLSACAQADRKTGVRLLASVPRRRATSDENELSCRREIGSIVDGLQNSSWYQQQMLGRKLGAREPLAHLPLSGRERLCFPDSSYESVSECSGSSNVSQMVLCHQAKLNERQISSKPCVAVPLPGMTKPLKKAQISLLPFRYPVSENTYSFPGCLPKAGRTCDEIDSVAPPRRAKCKKISAATKARRQRLSRAVSNILKGKKVDAHIGKPLEDDSTFAQVSPWGTFSCDSHADMSENGSFSLGANTQVTEVKRDQSQIQKRKPPALVKKHEGKGKKPCSAQTDATRINMAVQSTLSAIRLHTEIIGESEEKCRRHTESKTQRLKNIACCRALPAPPSAAGSDRRLPQITPSMTTENQSRTSEDHSVTTRSQSSGDLEPVTFSQCDEETKSKFTTIIEAVRIIERVHARRGNNSLRLDPPWPVPPLNESQGNRRISVTISKSGEPSQNSRPASGSNAANNASHETTLTRPAKYDPVELLKRFRESLSYTRGKGIGARARTEAAHAGKQAVSLKSLVRTLQRVQKQRVMSCISYDRDLAMFKTPSSPGKKPSRSPKSRLYSSSSKTKSRQSHTKRKEANRCKKPKQTFK